MSGLCDGLPERFEILGGIAQGLGIALCEEGRLKANALLKVFEEGIETGLCLQLGRGQQAAARPA